MISSYMRPGNQSNQHTKPTCQNNQFPKFIGSYSSPKSKPVPYPSEHPHYSKPVSKTTNIQQTNGFVISRPTGMARSKVFTSFSRRPVGKRQRAFSCFSNSSLGRHRRGAWDKQKWIPGWIFKGPFRVKSCFSMFFTYKSGFPQGLFLKIPFSGEVPEGLY